MKVSRAIALIVALISLTSPLHEAYAGDGLKRLRVVIGKYKGATDGDATERYKRQQEVLGQTRSRLEKRLEAADVKYSVVQLEKDGTITIEVNEKRGHSWYIGLIVTPGLFEIRPQRKGEINWTALAELVPEGCELRSEDDPAIVHVWCADRNALSGVAERVHIPGHAVVIGPTTDGWRTYTMGSTVASNAHLRSAKRQISKTGHPFVALKLSDAIAERLAASRVSKVQQWGVILDGEMLGMVSTDALTRRQLVLSTPGRLATRESQLAWVSQVAGRLAAYLPIPIGVLEE